jgi:hypothetical protein
VWQGSPRQKQLQQVGTGGSSALALPRNEYIKILLHERRAPLPVNKKKSACRELGAAPSINQIITHTPTRHVHHLIRRARGMTLQ